MTKGAAHAQHQNAAESGLLKRIALFYPFRHLLHSFLQPVSKDHFCDLPKHLHPNRNTQHLFAQKQPHSDQPQHKHVLLLRLFGTFRSQLIFASVFVLLSTVLAMLGPLLLKKIVHFMEKHKTLKSDQQTAHYYLLMWVGAYLLRVTLGQFGDKSFFDSGIQVDQTLTEAITRKIAKLPVSIKRHIPKGELMNYIMIDVKLVGYFFKYVSIAISSPATVLMATALLLLSGQPYSIIMALVLIQFTLVLLVIAQRMAANKRDKFEHQYERVNSAVELITQIKELRSLGYEYLLEEKAKSFRTKENASNFSVYCYTYLYDCLLAAIPIGVILWVLLKQQVDPTDKSISAEQLYSVFGYSVLITYPLKYLRSFVVSTYDMLFALSRIQKFLQLPEVVASSSLQRELQPGELVLQNLVMHREPLEDRHPKLFEQPQTIHQRTVTVPLTVQLPAGSKVHLLSRHAEGRHLLNALGGLASIDEGRVSFGGNMSYLPCKPWLLKDTIKENILYGLSFDEARFNEVCEICELSRAVEVLAEGFETVVADINNFSYTVSKKIAMARYLYTAPDILLLDDPFQGVEPRTAKRIYRNIIQANPSSTVLIACDQPQLISETDCILLFQTGTAVAFRTAAQLLSDPASLAHEFIVPSRQTHSVEKDLEMRTKLAQHFKESQQYHQETQNSHHSHEDPHSLPQHLTEGHEAHQTGEHGHPAHSHLKHGHGHASHDHQPNGKLRQPRIPFYKHWKLLNASQSGLIRVVIALMVVSQLVKAFSAWWVSHVSHAHGKIKLRQQWYNSNLFVTATAVFCLVHLLEGMLSAYLSQQNSEQFSAKTMKALAKSDMTWFEEHDLIVVAYKANKDFEDTFTLTYYLQTVTRNILLFLFTLLSVAMEVPSFFIVGIVIAALSAGVYLAFSRAERQIMRYYTPTYEDGQRQLDQYIEGIESVLPLNQIEKLKEPWHRKLYDLYVVRLNEKYLYQGLNIISELIYVGIILALCEYGIASKKLLGHHGLHVLVTLVAYSGKLSSLATAIVKDAAYVENIMRLSVKKNLDIMQLVPEDNYDKVSEEFYWPRSSAVELTDIEVSNGSKKPQLSVNSFILKEGSRAMLIGRQGNGVDAFKKIISGQRKWENYHGTVKLDGKDLKAALPREKSEEIMHLAARPFNLTGSLRQNIDPLGQHRDRDILRALSHFHIDDPLRWKIAETDQNPSQHFLDQRINFEDISTNMRNSISIIRALLRQPKLLICDYLEPNRCMVTAEDLLAQRLRETTIISDSMSVVDSLRASKILIFEDGRLVEADSPIGLLTKQTPFTEFIRDCHEYSRP